jgi:RNA polymerase sigma-70 factor (ECF subfamily)
MREETPVASPRWGEGFPTTIWTHIHSAREGSARHLHQILARYRGPIVAFIRRKGFREDAAEDMAQEVLLRLSRPGFFDKVDPVRGRFRSLVVAVTRHVVSEELRRDRAAKRGGARVIAAGAMSDSTLDLYRRGRLREDPVFDQLWVKDLVESALRELERHSRESALPLAEAFRLKYREGLTQEEVAERLRCTLFNAKNWIYYGKLKFKELVLVAIKDTCATPEEYEDEVRRLSPWLRGAGTE